MLTETQLEIAERTTMHAARALTIDALTRVSLGVPFEEIIVQDSWTEDPRVVVKPAKILTEYVAQIEAGWEADLIVNFTDQRGAAYIGEWIAATRDEVEDWASERDDADPADAPQGRGRFSIYLPLMVGMIKANEDLIQELTAKLIAAGTLTHDEFMTALDGRWFGAPADTVIPVFEMFKPYTEQLAELDRRILEVTGTAA